MNILYTLVAVCLFTIYLPAYSGKHPRRSQTADVVSLKLKGIGGGAREAKPTSLVAEGG